MKKVNLLSTAVVMLMASAAFTGCKTDTDGLWENIHNINDRLDALEKMVSATNKDLTALQTIVNSVQNQVTITSVEKTENGYIIKFSDGNEATITNGVDGADAPEISVVVGEDGKYYWTLDGTILTVDGKKVCASGTDAVAPQVRVNPDTKMWEVSADGGKTWESTGVVAEGTSGGSGVFSSVDSTNEDYVIFTLADGTTFSVPRSDAGSPVFAIAGAQGVQGFVAGETREYDVEASNVADFIVSKPDGWRVKYADSKLSITAPDAANIYAEKEGIVALNVVSASGKSMIVKISVAMCELRVLTFEDADAKFSPYTLNYCNVTVNTWSDLIDSKQYGGEMLYGDGMGMDEPYYWYDEGNTELMHVFAETYESYCYWYGGQPISNYHSTNLSDGSFMNQLAVYGEGGHNGSANFAVHNGYMDGSSSGMTTELPSIVFYDGKARVIDHMYVNNTIYAVATYRNDTTVKADDYALIEATGYDAAGTKVGTTEFYLFRGTDNIVTEWTKWDLSCLGAVAKVEFNIKGSLANQYGLTTPAYFAYDDVAVRF